MMKLPICMGSDAHKIPPEPVSSRHNGEIYPRMHVVLALK